MKKVISLILCATMILGIAMCFGGCGDKGTVGKYNLKTMSVGDTTINVDDLKALSGQDGLEFYLELKNDGTAELVMGEERQALLYKDGKMWAEDQEDQKVPFTVKGNTLTLEQDGAKLTFKK